MNETSRREPLLRVRPRGPGVRDGRIPSEDLVRFGRQLQTAVDRVAKVLGGQTASVRPGCRPDQIRAACALEVVALGRGSFELAIDLRREQRALPGMERGTGVYLSARRFEIPSEIR
jgi:hypothetical protein